METLNLINFWETNTVETTTAEPGDPIIDLKLKPCPFQDISNRIRNGLRIFEQVMADRDVKTSKSNSTDPFWGQWYSRLFMEVDSFVFLAFITFDKMVEKNAELSISEKFCCHKWCGDIVDESVSMTCKSELLVCRAFYNLVIPDTSDCQSRKELAKAFPIAEIEVFFDELMRSIAQSNTLKKLIVVDKQKSALQFKKKDSKSTKNTVSALKTKNAGALADDWWSRTNNEYWYVSPAIGLMIKMERESEGSVANLSFAFESCVTTTTPSISELKDSGRNRRARPRRTFDRPNGVMILQNLGGVTPRDWKLAKFDMNLFN